MQRSYLKNKKLRIFSNLARHVPDATKASEIHVIAKMFMLYFLRSCHLDSQNITCQ